MIKRFMPVAIGLTEDYEYSLDDGSTWIQVNGGSKTVVEPETLPSSKIVKVRSSSENNTSIDKGLFDLAYRIYDEFNIKNGKSLTAVNDLFKYANINKIRLANINNVTNASHCFYGSSSKIIFVDKMPLILNTSAMFMYSNSEIVSNIIMSEQGGIVDDASSMFREAKVKILGDILLNGDAIMNMNSIFLNSDIEFFPYFNLATSRRQRHGINPSYGMQYMIKGMRSKYMLECTISEIDDGIGSQTSNSNSFLSNIYAFQGNQFKFSGLNIFRSGPISDSGIDANPFRFMGSGVVTPFRMISGSGCRPLYSSSYSNFTNGSSIGNYISEAEYTKAKQIGGKLYFPNWFPDVIELESYQNDEMIGVTSMLAKDYNLEIRKGSISKKAINISGYYDKFGESTPVSILADQVYSSRNGVRAYRNSNVVTIYEDDQSVRKIIDVGSDAIAGNLSSTGEHMMIVYGDRYDTVVGGTQQLTGSIKKFNTITGVLVEDIAITLPENTEITGVWYPSDESNLQVIVTYYDENDSANNTSKIITRKVNGIFLPEYSLSSIVNIVGPNYWEDNEFVCINNLTGNIIRCIGK